MNVRKYRISKIENPHTILDVPLHSRNVIKILFLYVKCGDIVNSTLSGQGSCPNNMNSTLHKENIAAKAE